jgi:hypothetical protein
MRGLVVKHLGLWGVFFILLDSATFGRIDAAFAHRYGTNFFYAEAFFVIPAGLILDRILSRILPFGYFPSLLPSCLV